MSVSLPSRLDGAPCIVTGGLRFIGSAVVHRLAESGASLVVVDSLERDSPR